MFNKMTLCDITVVDSKIGLLAGIVSTMLVGVDDDDDDDDDYVFVRPETKDDVVDAAVTHYLLEPVQFQELDNFPTPVPTTTQLLLCPVCSHGFKPCKNQNYNLRRHLKNIHD
ncbi:hypothetical protein BGX24_012046, partial [Mortierella sp. AD032]